MTAGADGQGVDFLRKPPTQRRSRTTIGFIAEAASQVLRASGEEAVTTTAVAERAGVSIGTVYQYFADRDALLRAAADHDRQRHLERLRELLSRQPRTDDPVREFVRAIIRSMAERQGARRQFTLLAVAAIAPGGSWRRDQFAAIIAEYWHRRCPELCPRASRIDAFVLVQAMAGVLHSAALAEPAILREPGFEDALCRLTRSFWPRPGETAGRNGAVSTAET